MQYCAVANVIGSGEQAEVSLPDFSGYSDVARDFNDTLLVAYLGCITKGTGLVGSLALILTTSPSTSSQSRPHPDHRPCLVPGIAGERYHREAQRRARQAHPPHITS